jgi:uncharacterized coiled-coil protein SlyX
MGVYKEATIERDELETELTNALRRLNENLADEDEAAKIRERVRAIYARLEDLRPLMRY